MEKSLSYSQRNGNGNNVTYCFCLNTENNRLSQYYRHVNWYNLSEINLLICNRNHKNINIFSSRNFIS